VALLKISKVSVWLPVLPGPSQTNPKKKNNTRTHPGGYLVLRSYLPYIGGSHRMCVLKKLGGPLNQRKRKKKNLKQGKKLHLK
jgi:hypothetical protein